MKKLLIMMLFGLLTFAACGGNGNEQEETTIQNETIQTIVEPTIQHTIDEKS